MFLSVTECEICPEYPCQYFHLYGYFIYTLFEKLSLFTGMGSVYEHCLYHKHRSIRLILTCEVGQGMLVGSAASIPCVLYYRYTTGIHPGVVTAPPAALSVPFTFLTSGAHSWRRQKINRGGITEKLRERKRLKTRPREETCKAQSVGFKHKSYRAIDLQSVRGTASWH